MKMTALAFEKSCSHLFRCAREPPTSTILQQAVRTRIVINATAMLPENVVVYGKVVFMNANGGVAAVENIQFCCSVVRLQYALILFWIPATMYEHNENDQPSSHTSR